MAEITHAPVASSFITSAGYDVENTTAEVQFANGKRYRILGMEPEAFDALINAESVGRHFNTLVKGAYTVEPVTATEEP